MKKLLLFLAALATVLMAGTAVFASEGEGPEANNWYVCKYVGPPGVDEVLQTGQNPIFVDESAIPVQPVVIGAEFADAQGHSVVVAGPYAPPGIQPGPGTEICPLTPSTTTTPPVSTTTPPVTTTTPPVTTTQPPVTTTAPGTTTPPPATTSTPPPAGGGNPPPGPGGNPNPNQGPGPGPNQPPTELAFTGPEGITGWLGAHRIEAFAGLTLLAFIGALMLMRGFALRNQD